MHKFFILLAAVLLFSSTVSAQTYSQVNYKGKKAFILPEDIEYNIFLHQSEPDFQDYRDSLGLPDGYWVLFYYNDEDLPAIEGEIRNGGPEGEWKRYSLVTLSSGNRSSLSTLMNFRDGLEDGPFEIYDEAGRITLNTGYRKGYEHGPYTNRFRVSGEVQNEGAFYMGLKSGKWNFYSLPGILSKSVSFLDSVPEDSVSYYSRKETETGKQQIKGVNDPMLHGPYIIYRNGKPAQELTFHRGRATYYRAFLPSGEVAIEGSCKKLVRVKMTEKTEGFMGLPPQPKWELWRKGTWANNDPTRKIPKKFVVEGFEVLY